MSLLIILGILGIQGAASVHEEATKSTRVSSHDQNERIMLEMLGKSKREARKILRKYR